MREREEPTSGWEEEDESLADVGRGQVELRERDGMKEAPE